MACLFRILRLCRGTLGQTSRIRTMISFSLLLLLLSSIITINVFLFPVTVIKVFAIVTIICSSYYCCCILMGSIVTGIITSIAHTITLLLLL